VDVIALHDATASFVDELDTHSLRLGRLPSLFAQRLAAVTDRIATHQQPPDANYLDDGRRDAVRE